MVMIHMPALVKDFLGKITTEPYFIAHTSVELSQKKGYDTSI